MSRCFKTFCSATLIRVERCRHLVLIILVTVSEHSRSIVRRPRHNTAITMQRIVRTSSLSRWQCVTW